MNWRIRHKARNLSTKENRITMALIDLKLKVEAEPLPHDVRALLDEADRRIEVFQRDSRVPAFVATDFALAYRVLQAVSTERLASGPYFCEWGSGYGVIACLAAMLGFHAVGIEIDAELVHASRKLADDFGLPIEFIHGSFLPAGCKVEANLSSNFTWLDTSNGRLEESEVEPANFDVIYAYPWPDEQHVAAEVFDRYARRGALLITYHGGDKFRVRRKRMK